MDQNNQDGSNRHYHEIYARSKTFYYTQVMQFAFITWNHTIWSSRISGLNGNMIEVDWTHSTAWAAFHFLLWSSDSLRIYFCMVPSAILAFVPSKWWRDLDSRSSVTCPVCTIYHFLQILSSCTIFNIDLFLLFIGQNKIVCEGI